MVHFVVATHYIFLKHSVAIFANEYTEYKVVHFFIKHSTVYITREIWLTHSENSENLFQKHVLRFSFWSRTFLIPGLMIFTSRSDQDYKSKQFSQ